MSTFAIILAAGSGSRIKSSDVPKQFVVVGGKSILQLTVDKFVFCNAFDKIVIALSKPWLAYAKDIFSDTLYNNVDFCIGGATRQESLYNATLHLKQTCHVVPDSIAVSHDAARPFVSRRIIFENIEKTKEYDAVDTVIPATDTIVESRDGEFVTSIPERKHMYQGQTPQSFKLLQYMQAYENLDSNTLEQMTDAVRILCQCGIQVGLVQGEIHNIKITHDYDIGLCQYLFKVAKKND